ncbi:SMP-30/gluconolactonase/LRE family protein [Bordetella sp. BOR01]|uniref:SMP-30/gluconolactonase/LRE family protein n=1 Tax=Bordetella sp. BOR01 TaxID=2854779 RepID=UPI001C44C9FF|nr:SMP-30/gluconolactonase/LRE family protein [Bordetella sp. BOR01]MBV7486564.1 SMP-30/gluconolactonase/LRE family protein [Bordetella sp. BOR01]
MYAPPPQKKLEVFASIPQRFHISGRKSNWIDVQLHGADTPAFLEGPAFDAHGNLWVVDIPWGRLFKIDRQGEISCELEYDGEPNGLAFHADGRAFIADNKNGLMVFDPARGTVEPFLDRALVQRFKGPNDLVFAGNGDLYFTDQGQTGHHDPTGRLYRLAADGRLDCLLNNVPSPNGLVLNLAEDTVYLAVTRANAIWRVPLVKKHGTVTKVGTYIQMSGGGGPDGMALGAHGGVAVCHVGLGAVWIFDEVGQPVLRLDAPASRMTTNCAYGGSDLRRLYVTAGREILVAEADMAGAPTWAQRSASPAVGK